MDRILGLQGRPPLLANPDLEWQIDPMLRMSERLPPVGYRVLLVGDRQALHTVSLSFLISDLLPFVPISLAITLLSHFNLFLLFVMNRNSYISILIIKLIEELYIIGPSITTTTKGSGPPSLPGKYWPLLIEMFNGDSHK